MVWVGAVLLIWFHRFGDLEWDWWPGGRERGRGVLECVLIPRFCFLVGA